MKKMNDNLSSKEKSNIIFRALVKVFRGSVRSCFFKESKFPIFIGKHVTILNGYNITTGKNVKFEDYCEIQGLSNNVIKFGENVTIGRNVKIRPSSYYGVGKIGEGLIIGENSSIGPGGFVGCAGKVTIGNNVMIGPNVTIIAENHVFESKSRSIKSQGVTQKGIFIDDDVWIGANVTILDGVRISKGSIIGAGTLITRSIDTNSIVLDKRNKLIRGR